MQILYGLTLASLAFALALTVPSFLPERDFTPLGVAHAQTQAETSPAPLCGNIFDGSGSLCAPLPATPETVPVAGDELVSCDALTLLGVVRDGDTADRALFAGQGVVKRGEETDGGYSLLEVYADRTVLSRGDLRCEVSLFDAQEGTASAQASASGGTLTTTSNIATSSTTRDFPIRGGRVQVPRAAVSLASSASLAGVSAIPTPNGIRLRGIAPTSLPARLGLRSGDLIVEVDGRPLTPDSALALATRLGELEQISARVRRGREVVTLRADVVD